jgi:feruloyl-CoA synthase
MPIPTTTAIGFPTLGQEVRIVRDDGSDASPEEPGEILFRSPSIFAGYLNDPESTRAAFTEDGWFRTGDLACMDAHGYLTFVDRKKDMIKSKGENVAAAEVERVLNEHPGVLESAVVGEREEQGLWGERVVAYVVRRNSASADETELKEWTRAKLADFKVPQAIFFVDALPKTPLGKIQRGLLRSKPAPGAKS